MFSIRKLLIELEGYRDHVDDDSRAMYESRLQQLRSAEAVSCQLHEKLKSELELTMVSRIFEDTEGFYKGLRHVGLGCLSLFSTAIQSDGAMKEGSKEYIETILKSTQTLIAIAQDLEEELIEEYPQAQEMRDAIEQYKSEVSEQDKKLH